MSVATHSETDPNHNFQSTANRIGILTRHDRISAIVENDCDAVRNIMIDAVKTIRSVLAQRSYSYELISNETALTAATLELLAEFRKTDPAGYQALIVQAFTQDHLLRTTRSRYKMTVPFLDHATYRRPADRASEEAAAKASPTLALPAAKDTLSKPFLAACGGIAVVAIGIALAIHNTDQATMMSAAPRPLSSPSAYADEPPPMPPSLTATTALERLHQDLQRTRELQPSVVEPYIPPTPPRSVASPTIPLMPQPAAQQAQTP